MTVPSIAVRARVSRFGYGPAVARRALLVPVMVGLFITIVTTWAGPWSSDHRVVLSLCEVVGGLCIALECAVSWDRLSALAYLPVPALGLLAIGAGMWVSGGWGSPFAPFLMLPVAYATIAVRLRYAVPVGALAGVVAASPGLYVPHASPATFLFPLLGATAAFVVLVVMIGRIVEHLRSSDVMVALEAEARRHSEARAHDLLVLQRVCAIVGTHLSMPDAIDAIMQELSATFGHSLISIYLRDGDRLVMQSQLGYDVYYETLTVGQGVIGTTCACDETMFIADVRKDSRYLEAAGGVKSEIAVPLRDEGRVVGVLNIESRSPLSARDRDLMELFGSQVSVVLRNARLAGELRHQAERDSLTGLLNYRALMQVLERAIASGGPCAVLVIDLDDFKRINDMYGHLAGDAALQHVASVLHESCRGGDACCRSGGDEFVVVLPGTGRAGAQRVATRITATMRAQPFVAQNAVALPITFSIGTAVAPEDAATREELLAHADHAMYSAKHAPVGSAQSS